MVDTWNSPAIFPFPVDSIESIVAYSLIPFQVMAAGVELSLLNIVSWMRRDFSIWQKPIKMEGQQLKQNSNSNSNNKNEAEFSGGDAPANWLNSRSGPKQSDPE